MKRLACSLAACALVATTGHGAVLINEIRIDDESTDTDEYFELRGNPSESLAGLTYVVIGDGTGGSGTIDTAIDLGAFNVGASGYFLAANASLGTDVTFSGTIDLTLATNAFENSDNVTHLLVAGFTGAAGDDLDVDDDGVIDVLPWSSIVDGVAIIESDTIPPTNTEWAYGANLGLPEIGPDGGFVPGHVYRTGDTGPWAIGPFNGSVVDTPGAANIPEPAAALLGALGLLGLVRRRR